MTKQQQKRLRRNAAKGNRLRVICWRVFRRMDASLRQAAGELDQAVAEAFKAFDEAQQLLVESLAREFAKCLVLSPKDGCTDAN